MSKLLFRSALILCIGSWSASAAFAQQVSLTINNGRVTLKATNATVRQILDEWARVGGTKIVNAEKLSGQPVTLTLIDEPEGPALETVLRSAAGYMVSEKATPAPTGSRFDRIMLMGRTTPVTSTASAASTQNAYTMNGPTPPGGAIGAEGPVNADEEEPPQPAAPVVNPYAPAGAAAGAQAGVASANGTPGTGAPGAVNPATNTGVPGMNAGIGQQNATATQGAQPNPGYSNIYGQPAMATGTGTTTTANPPEVKFDYANPQKYFQNRAQTGSAAQPYPGVPLSPTAAGTANGTPSATGVPGTGAAGTITPQVPAGTPANQNPYSPNFNPYNMPAGQGVPAATPGTTSAPTPVEPDRAKYANPYLQPGTQQPQQQPK